VNLRFSDGVEKVVNEENSSLLNVSPERREVLSFTGETKNKTTDGQKPSNPQEKDLANPTERRRT